MTSPLMERLDSQQKRKLSRILGVPISMEDATQKFIDWTGMNVTCGEVTEYFCALRKKLEEAFDAASRNQNDWQVAALTTRMWWRTKILEAALTQAPARYIPTTEEDKLRAENRELSEQLAYWRGYGACALLALKAQQKGAQ